MLKSLKKIWVIFEASTKRRAFLLLVLMLFGSVAEAGSIGLIFPLIEVVLQPEAAKENPFTKYLVETIGIDQNDHAVAMMFFLAFGLFLIKNVYLLYMENFKGQFIWDTLSGLWIRLYRYYLDADYPFHVKRNSSTLVNHVTVTLRNMFYGFVMPLLNMCTELFVLLAVGVMLIIVDPLITLSAVAVLTSTTVIYYLAFRRRLGHWGEEQLIHHERMLLWLNQGLGGIKEIKVLGREAYAGDSFAESARINAMYSQHQLLVSQMPRYLIETVVIGGLLLGIYLIFLTSDSISDPLPIFGLFGVAAFRLMPSASRITTYAGHIRFGGASLDAVYEDFLQLDPRNQPELAARQEQSAQFITFEKKIALRNVSFRYSGTNRDVLKDVSLQIPKGKAVALVGTSGAGKTTLADIILGLLVPDSGTLEIDGHPVGTVTRPWQRHIGCIPQEVFLMDNTLRANIAFGVPPQEINETHLQIAVSQAQLTEAIAQMPEGLNTMVGERGIRLSGGQRQRVGIARALYANADLLVMDEATSALDSETEHAITKAIENLHGSKTIIIIAHRLSTVRHCDRIYFMQDGRIVDEGTFEELHDKNKAFCEMVRKMDVSVKDREKV
ncbi:MAG: hypothetical protein A2516_08625 [Alphaproteobacteria bacterium RIFOXYD12_FULL_60_8]|nr:MAG: hypothetical protein A2516_08625 [Alphaproteobacteria bacterium RIFOXYD12_FULL_60_8]